MPTIYVDADACPVKDEVEKVASRYRWPVILVCDGGVRPPQNPLVTLRIVQGGPDAADDWIAEQIGSGDVCVTNDIPLADRCVKAGATAIRPKGEVLDEAAIGMALASRNLMTDLREQGLETSGPRPFSKQDRSHFLQALDRVLQKGR